MPSIITGDLNSNVNPSQASYEYSYPGDLNLKPGSPLHTFVKDQILQRARASALTMSQRHKTWQTIDHTLTAYIKVDDKERLVKGEDSRKPVSIVFPYSYTVLETLLSYYVAAFLQDPIFRYEGTGPNDVIGAILLEKLIALQCIKNKVGLNLHTQARDSFSYGFGVATPTWVKEVESRDRTVSKPGFLGFGSKESTVTEDVVTFEGNALENIDPYLYLPDVNFPIHEPQKGEYNGSIVVTNLMDLLTREKNSGGEYFNVQYLKHVQWRRTSIFASDNSGRDAKSGVPGRPYSSDVVTNPVDVIRMFIRLIPKDWKLGDSEYPEMWYFELASDEIVIKAEKAVTSQNRYPISVIAPDYDGYSMAPVSRIEILNGLQGVLDFMFNSHVKNVRKAIHDMIIYDPYQVNSNDLKNPSEGKLIRLRRPAWGRGVKDVAQQLAVSDVTRGNVADSTWIVQWMDRISGADAAMQGSLRQGGPERLTSAEFQGTMGAGVNRMERIARVVGMQGMQDIGSFFGYHNRQMMSVEAYIKLAGDWQEVLTQEFGTSIDRGRIRVNPADLDINYNIIVRDGSVPGGNYSQSWIQLYQILANSPELAQHFDVVRIFTHIARNLGAKNVNDFVRKGGNIQSQAMPNEQVAEQAQAGNIVPLNMGGMV